MIKFFRKIRKQLATENKTMAYSRYAIGEIVLVVIGILIALSINNWNENKKKTASAMLHLETISKNVAEDIVQLENLYHFTDTILGYTNKLSRQFQTLDSIDQNTTLYISGLLLEKSLSPNKTGLETLNNSGELAYVPKTVQELLLKYYNVLDNIAAREEISNTFIKIRYEPYFFEHYAYMISITQNWSATKNYYKNDPRIPIKLDKEKIINDREFEAIIFGRHYQIKQQHVLYKDAIDIAKNLLKIIKK